jgi:hypothetical protein
VSDATPSDDTDWERTRETHAGLSEVDVRFRELARRDPELLRGDSGDGGAPPEAAQLRSPRQPWPLFISADRARELADAAVAVSRLVRSLPERIFGNDAARMAAFYGHDEAFLRLALQPPNAIADGLSRGDFIDSPQGFRCLEQNIGGNLGGLDNCLVARLALATPAIRRFVAALGGPDGGMRVRHRDTFHLLARYVIYQALSGGISNGEVNVALVLSVPVLARAALGAFFVREYETLLAEIGPPLRGQLFICGNEGMTVERGALHRFGVRLHAVIEWDTARLDPMIVRCFKTGTLHLYNGPTSGVLSDKRNIALLSEGLESDAFSAEEKAAIERHVPWTRRLVPGPLERLAAAKREGLVLKKAWSHGGAGVVLGRESAPAAWEHAVGRALSEGDWILQEHVESRPYLFQHGDGCRIHRVAWGPYVFGSEYAGMFVRAQAEAEGGVINATHGATSAPLFEVATGGAAEAAPSPGPPPGSG